MSNTTTSMFQINPDFYDSLEQIKTKRKRISTNPRYKKYGFFQTHFTAGDNNQFQQYRYPYNSKNPCRDVKINEDNKFVDVKLPSIEWHKYQDLTPISVDNTFNYIFNKFKKGIFVKIQDNELKVFLPFSKVNYTNEWSDHIKVEPKYKDMMEFAKHINNLIGNKYKLSVNKFTNQWYGNNCLVRYEFPTGEGDTNNPSASDMLKTLCQKRKVPDIEFFLNRRDFPILKKNSTEAYNHLFDNDNLPLLSHNYDKYSPVFSYCSSDEFADIIMPTWDDWNRISSYKGKFYPKGKKYPLPEDFNQDWNTKIPTAIFRGTTTGCGVDEKTNLRIKLAYMSVNQPKNNPPLLDAKISSWQVRPKKLQGQKYLKTIDIPRLEKLGIFAGSFLTPIEQSNYKYIINVDGNVSAFRLSLELSMGSCILLVKSNYKIWYSHMLIPYEHYVPVKNDLTDLFDIIRWCRDNDEKCKNIANNARKFYDTYLSEDGQLDYLQKLLIEVKQYTGTYLYNYSSPLDLQLKQQLSIINSYKSVKTIPKINIIPKQGRNYGMLEGLKMLINNIDFLDRAEIKDVIVSSSYKKVSKYILAGFTFIFKETIDDIRNNENINEIFIGLMGINSLVKYVPNFSYMFGIVEKEDKKCVISEYINGKTLSEWIKSDKFNVKELLFILIQIGLALEISQKKCGFVHYDLTPWNILVIELPNPISFDYLIDIDNIYQIETKFIPVIVDYGKSHIIYDNRHYGFSKNKFSSIQDIITILLEVLDELAETKQPDINSMIKLANFISGTGYRKNMFRPTGANGLSDIRYFLRTEKKYDRLLSSNKYELEKKSPINFVKYILDNFKLNFPIKKILNPTFRIDKGNTRQIYDYVISNDEDEKILSYINMFNRVSDCKLVNGDENVFFIYYVLQTIENNITSVYNSSGKYKDNNDITKAYKNVLNILNDIYEKIIKREASTLEFNIPDVKLSLDFDENIFLSPKNVYAIIEKYKKYNITDIDYGEYRLIIETVLTNSSSYKMTEKHKQFYIDNFADILRKDMLKIKIQDSDINTLRILSREIYTEDLSYLEQLDNCSLDVKDYIDLYKKILSR